MRGLGEMGKDQFTPDPAKQFKFFSEKSGKLQISAFQLTRNVHHTSLKKF